MQRSRLNKWSVSAGGPITQPRRKDGIACDFDRLEMTTARSDMPARDHALTCGRAKARSSYTSSDSSQRSFSRHIAAILAISSAVKTAPVGLWGELIQITLVRGVIALLMLSRSGWKFRSARSG